MSSIDKNSTDTEDLLQLLQEFKKINPCEFTQEQFEKVETNILHPRGRTVYDEYLDFKLWVNGLKTRQEYYSEFVEMILPIEKYHSLLEVGCGENAMLSRVLVKKGYRMTAMDPKLNLEKTKVEEITGIKDVFEWDKADISKYDAVIAQEPCEAAEHLIRACKIQKKNLMLTLCGVPHTRLDGIMPEDVFAWHDYLKEIGGENCKLVRNKMIPGCITTLVVGVFGEKTVESNDGSS